MKKTVGEIVKGILDHGDSIYLASAYPAILKAEMRKGGYSEDDQEYGRVVQDVSQGVNAFRRRNRRAS